MSAAATSAGYLYASGRLRGRGGELGQHDHYLQPQPQPQAQPQAQPQPAPRAKLRVAVLERDYEPQRRVPKIEYRVRKRWSIVE